MSASYFFTLTVIVTVVACLFNLAAGIIGSKTAGKTGLIGLVALGCGVPALAAWQTAQEKAEFDKTYAQIHKIAAALHLDPKNPLPAVIDLAGKRAAQLHARIEELETRLKFVRPMSEETRSRVIQILAQQKLPPEITVYLTYPDDLDIEPFALRWADIMRSAGWRVEAREIAGSGTGSIVIKTRDNKVARGDIDRLATIMTQMGTPPKILYDGRMTTGRIRIIIGGGA